MKLWTKNITLKQLSFVLDFLLICCMLAVFGKTYMDLKHILLNQKELEHRRILDGMQDVIDNFIVQQIQAVQITIPFLDEVPAETVRRKEVFSDSRFLKALYSVSDDMKLEDMFYYHQDRIPVRRLDLSASQTVPYINRSKELQKTIITPIHTSVISGKESISFIFPFKTGVLIADLDIDGLFYIFNTTGLLNLYEGSIIFLLKPHSEEIIYRSSPIYPYRMFSPDNGERIRIDGEWYFYNRKSLKDIDLQMIVLTAEKYYFESFVFIQKFFLVLIGLILSFYLIRGFWVKRSFYRPLSNFLNAIKLNGRSEKISLESPYREWLTFEKIYNQMTHELNQSFDEIQKFNQELELRVQQRTSELAETNQKLSEAMNALWGEMELAKKIQTCLLPTGIHNIHPDFDITAYMLPADQVGGDFYDVTYDRKGNLWIAIGDVSGHGVTPGLIMMMAQTVHSTVTTTIDCQARDVVVLINEILYKNVHGRLNERHFMTFNALKYQGGGLFQHAGAHLTIIVYRQKTKSCELISTHGVYLNFKQDISKGTKNSEFMLEPGDVMVLYTDGITEAQNSEGKILDLDGLINIVETHIHPDVITMQDKIMTDVIQYCDNKRSDDMSLIIVKLNSYSPGLAPYLT